MSVPNEVRAFHGAVMREVMSRLSGQIQERELTPAQISTLFRLRAAGQLGVSDISGQLGLASGTTSHLVDRLVQRGLVSRVESTDDRRQKVLSLAPEGVSFLEAFDAWLNDALADLLRPVPAAILRDLGAALSRALPYLDPP